MSKVSRSSGIADDHSQDFVVDFVQRQDRVFAGDRLGDELHDGRGDRRFGQVDVFKIVFFGDGPHDLFRRGITEADQCFSDRRGLIARNLIRMDQLFLADVATAN